MSEEDYHRRIKAEKREAALKAAMELFAEQGYGRTSLQQIAQRAGLSTATLFKRFPTKGALFEAIVEAFWRLEGPEAVLPPPGDPESGLRALGADYAQRMRRPEMAALYRLIIAEIRHFPDLGQLQMDRNKVPYQSRMAEYLAAEARVGTLAIPDATRAAHQFMGLIAAEVLNPGLLRPDFAASDAEVESAVEEAVALLVTRYRPPPA
ncbi:MAG TPA: TetR/AcrR family transcriptional regulator [Aliidongia sp.]|nr:TetR/AcrR family transcriptional regulator [Aliidongia sp.]